MRRGLVAAFFCACLAGPAPAQDRAQSLADIRQELTVLHVEMQHLRRELSTTSGPTFSRPPEALLDRLDALESELRALTARTEELEGRVRRIVADGTRRVGDLEFRLVELEGGDVSRLGETTTLGGADAGGGLPPAVAPLPGTAPGGEMALGEEAAFETALAAQQAGDHAAAAEGFARFLETYPGGALSAEAHYWRGEALAAQGDWRAAARAFLDAYSGDPQGPRAAEALWKLGVGLDRVGQRDDACLTLAEVAPRFPGTPAAAGAEAEMQSLGCR